MFHLFEAGSTLVDLDELSSAQVVYHEEEDEFTLNLYMKNGNVIEVYYNYKDEADKDLRLIYDKLNNSIGGYIYGL